MAERKLLYIVPMIPSFTGNGGAMRAGMVLRALAARHQVTLLVVELYPNLSLESGFPKALESYCGQIVRVSRDSAVPRPSDVHPRRTTNWLRRVLRNGRTCGELV